MEPKYNGGAAFPLEGSAKRNASAGMSLRDYFAAKVYAAMIVGGHWSTEDSREDQARMAYVHADALIAERAK